MERPVDERLAEMAEWRELARMTLARISQDMPTLVREAHASGQYTKAEIARMAKVSRPALDAMLKQ